VVTLKEVTADTVRAICALDVGPEQRQFVAPNAVSIAEAHFEPKAWFRAVYADDEPVGFVMLEEDPAKPEYFLWRLMIDHRHQRKGFGRQTLDLVRDRVRALGGHELLSSYVPGDGSPGPFYLAYGFEETGDVHEGERVIRLDLSRPQT
jgi:diamine N-acetyltransferase